MRGAQCLVLVLVVTTVYSITSQNISVKCEDIRIPTLKGKLSNYARMCQPHSKTESQFYPLHLWCHGDGAWPLLYDSLMIDLARHGFVVVSYASCWFDSSCENGETSFMEVIA